MKKRSKKTTKSKKDLTSVYIALLALIVIIVVFFLAYLSKMSKMSPGTSTSTGAPLMNGQQTATITILPSGGVSSPASEVASNDASGSQQTSVQNHMNMVENSGSVPANGRVKFKIDHFKKLALQPLQFDILDENGKAYTPDDLQEVFGQKVHFIVVSSNLKEFQHLDPTYTNGKWNTLAYMPTPGTYYAYTDVTPVKGQRVVLRSDLIVQHETTDPITYPGLTPDLFAISKTFKAQLALSQALVLQQSVLSYHVTQGDQPTTLQPYLGNLGSVIIFRQGNIDSYTRANPLNSNDAQKGLAEFLTTFVKGGRYTAFAEFKLGSKVYTFPITFDVSG